MNIITDNLICPITHDLLVEPIALPCCGNVISKTILKQALEHSLTHDKKCPICRTQIKINIDSIPICKNIDYILEELKNNGIINNIANNTTNINIHICKDKIDSNKIDSNKIDDGNNKIKFSLPGGFENPFHNFLIFGIVFAIIDNMSNIKY